MLPQAIGTEVDLMHFTVNDGQISVTDIATAADSARCISGLGWRS
jgi:hypothetical protein